MGRREYLKDYGLTIDEKGREKAVYTGAWHEVGCDDYEYRRFRLTLAGEMVGAALAWGLCGGLGGDVTRAFYAALPFGVAALPMFFAFYYNFVIFALRRRFTRREFVQISQTAPGCLLVVACLGVAAGLGGMAYSWLKMAVFDGLIFSGAAFLFGALSFVARRELVNFTKKIR